MTAHWLRALHPTIGPLSEEMRRRIDAGATHLDLTAEEIRDLQLEILDYTAARGETPSWIPWSSALPGFAIGYFEETPIFRRRGTAICSRGNANADKESTD